MQKKRVYATIFTEKFKIKACVSIKEGFRLTDYLSMSDIQFIPLTKVEVKNFDDQILLKTDYICLNKSSIIFAKTERKG